MLSRMTKGTSSTLLMNKQHPEQPLTKAKLWIKGHKPKKCKNLIVDAKVAEVQAVIDLLPSTTNDGEVATEEDILTQVLDKDRPGRVRGLGAGFTKRKLDVGSQSDSKYDELKYALNKENARRKKLEIILAKKLGINLDEFDDDDVSEEHHTSISKNQVQCDVSVTPEVVKTPMSGQGNTHHHSVNEKCKLLNWNDNGEVVAIDSLLAMDPKSTVHGYTLGPDCYRINIEEVFVGRAEFYRAEPVFANLEDVRGSIIAWPIKYLLFDEAES